MTFDLTSGSKHHNCIIEGEAENLIPLQNLGEDAKFSDDTLLEDTETVRNGLEVVSCRLPMVSCSRRIIRYLLNLDQLYLRFASKRVWKYVYQSAGSCYP